MSDLFNITEADVKEAKDSSFPKAVFVEGDKPTLMLKEIKEKKIRDEDCLIFSYTVQGGNNDGKEHAEFMKPSKPRSKQFVIDMLEASFGKAAGHNVKELVGKQFTAEVKIKKGDTRDFVDLYNWQALQGAGPSMDDIPF